MPAERDCWDGRDGGEEKEMESLGADSDGLKLLDRAVKYYEGKDFQGSLDDFARSHAGAFQDAVVDEEKTGEHSHKLEYSALHRQFLELFEELLTAFAEDSGCTVQDLFAECQKAMEDDWCALFEEHQHHWFVEVLLASMEYDHFYRFMLKSARTHGVK